MQQADGHGRGGYPPPGAGAGAACFLPAPKYPAAAGVNFTWEALV